MEMVDGRFLGIDSSTQHREGKEHVCFQGRCLRGKLRVGTSLLG